MVKFFQRNEITKIPELFCHLVDMKRSHPFPNQTSALAPSFTCLIRFFFDSQCFCRISQMKFIEISIIDEQICCFDRYWNRCVKSNGIYVDSSANFRSHTRVEVAIIRLHRIGTREHADFNGKNVRLGTMYTHDSNACTQTDGQMRYTQTHHNIHT